MRVLGRRSRLANAAMATADRPFAAHDGRFALDVAEERRSRSDVADRAILSLAVLVIVARVFGALFVRLRQPRVIGEMVAGVALGPSVLGALAPGVGDYLFPPSVVDTLAVIAQVGLVLFMFTVGLELDMDLVRGSGPSATLISHFSIVLPMSLGLLLALAVYSEIGAGDFVAFALFTGAAMAVTAFPVLARIIEDTRRCSRGTVRTDLCLRCSVDGAGNRRGLTA